MFRTDRPLSGLRGLQESQLFVLHSHHLRLLGLWQHERKLHCSLCVLSARFLGEKWGIPAAKHSTARNILGVAIHWRSELGYPTGTVSSS